MNIQGLPCRLLKNLLNIFCETGLLEGQTEVNTLKNKTYYSLAVINNWIKLFSFDEGIRK